MNRCYFLCDYRSPFRTFIVLGYLASWSCFLVPWQHFPFWWWRSCLWLLERVVWYSKVHVSAWMGRCGVEFDCRVLAISPSPFSLLPSFFFFVWCSSCWFYIFFRNLLYLSLPSLGNYNKLMQYFEDNMNQILTNVNRRPVVWQEPFQNGVKLPPNTIVEAWKDPSVMLDVCRFVSVLLRFCLCFLSLWWQSWFLSCKLRFEA